MKESTMKELKKRMDKIKQEMQDIAREQIADYLITVLNNLREKILRDFQVSKEKFKSGKITEERLAIIEEQTLYFLNTINYWIETIGEDKFIAD